MRYVFTLTGRFLLICLLSLACVYAQNPYRVETVPNVQLLDATQYVSDPTHTLHAEDTARLNALIAQMRQDVDLETAIVVLPAYDTGAYGNAREFAHKLFNHWGIGNAQTNRGLLILLLTGEEMREIVFETGYGIEGDLPDALSKLIQTRKMVPHFKEGQWGAGLLAGMEEVQRVFAGQSELPALAQQEEPNYLLLFALAVISLVLFNIMLRVKRARAASDDVGKKRALGAAFIALCIPAALLFPFMLIYFFIYRMQKSISQNSTVRSGAAIGASGFSSNRSTYSSSSSRDSGGSWGGGSSGGGGSSTRF